MPAAFFTQKEGFMKKIFISDLDGTLLTDDKKITDNTLSIIKTLRDQGHMVAIATGRPYPSSIGTIPNLKEIFDFAIFNNGANIHDFKDNTIHDQFPLSSEIVSQIIQDYRPLGANPILFNGSTMFADFENNYTSRLSDFLNVQYTDVLTKVQETHEKIIFSAYGETMDAIEAHAIKHPKTEYRVFKSQSELIEFTDPRINKWVGIEYYLNKYNLDPKSVITFGDNDNDIEMVATAHTGYAMENATDAVKASTTFHAKSNNDEGVYEILKTFVK